MAYIHGREERPGWVGALIGVRRRAAGLTQQQLAERAGVSVGAVRDLEQGRTTQPRPVSAEGLGRVLGIDGHHFAVKRPHASQEGYQQGKGSSRLVHMANGAIRVNVLGPLSVTRGISTLDLRAERLRAVLALLALYTGNAVHREAIIDVIWAETPPPSAVNMTQYYISQLRRILDASARDADRPQLARPKGFLTSVGASYVLNLTAEQLDLLEFTDLASRAQEAASDGDAAQACEIYDKAVRLWRGDPLADVPLLRSHPAVAGLARQRAAVVLDFADAAAAARRHGAVLEHLQALADREPLDERAHARLMVALAATSQQAAALKIFEELRQRLDKELGVGPSPALLQAHMCVLRGKDPSPGWSAAEAAVTPTAPVKRSRGSGAIMSQTQPRLVVPRQLPPTSRHFSGRAGELKALWELLGRPGSRHGAITSVIGGMAGVGKTALAVHWAHDAAERFPDGQLFVDLRGVSLTDAPVNPARVIQWFLASLGVSAQQIPPDPEAQAALYRSMLAEKRMLIVLDNAHDAHQVRPLQPGSPECHVVVTTRSRLTGLAVMEGAHLLSLDVLAESEAYKLLARRLGGDRLVAEPQGARDLVEFCGGLPLALAIIATRAAASPSLPLSMLADELRSESCALTAFETGDAACSVRAAFSESYRQLTEPTARMLKLLASQATPDIATPDAACLAEISSDRAQNALAELFNAHLLAEPSPGRYTMHRLLRAYALEQAVPECDHLNWPRFGLVSS